MTESNGTVNTLHREFSALLTLLQRCQKDNKTNVFNRKRELEETRLRSSEDVNVTSYNPHLVHDQEVEGDQHQPDTNSKNVAFTEAIGHVSYLKSCVLRVQLAYIPICAQSVQNFTSQESE